MAVYKNSTVMLLANPTGHICQHLCLLYKAVNTRVDSLKRLHYMPRHISFMFVTLLWFSYKRGVSWLRCIIDVFNVMSEVCFIPVWVPFVKVIVHLSHSLSVVPPMAVGHLIHHHHLDSLMVIL